MPESKKAARGSKTGTGKPRGGKCVIVFIKYPEKGKVKSRLGKVIGDEKACRLYRNFVLDILETVNGIAPGECAVIVCFHPPHAAQEIKNWLGETYAYMPQRGSDLGEKMKNAFLDAFAEGFTTALLMGSDIPDLPGTIIAEGFAALEENDVVLGPTPDGGYYLIGFTIGNFPPGVFTEIDWSAGEVFKRTLEKLNSAHCCIHVLPTWTDIDTYEDLQTLRERHRSSDCAHSRTTRYLGG